MEQAALALWNRLPIIVRAVVTGTIVSLIGVGTWSAFALANQRYFIAVPWAIVPTGIFLWFYIRYLNGEGWPKATSHARRLALRANAIPADTFGAAFFAGLLGIMSVPPFAAVLSRLVRLPAEAQPIHTPAGMPFPTVMLLLVTASIVAGVVEEAAFRGYIQGPIERRHGPVSGILGTGLLFGLAHFTHHPAGVIAMLPYYVYIAAVFGGLAWLTNSIWPSVVVHATGDVFSLGQLWMTGKAEWQMTTSSGPARLIWEGGADAAFFANLTAFIVLGGAATAAYIGLAHVTRDARQRAHAAR